MGRPTSRSLLGGVRRATEPPTPDPADRGPMPLGPRIPAQRTGIAWTTTGPHTPSAPGSLGEDTERGLTVPTLWARLGDTPARRASFRHLQGQAGTVPVTKRSGKQQTVTFRAACDKLLRYVVDQVAFLSLRHRRVGARLLRPAAGSSPRSSPGSLRARGEVAEDHLRHVAPPGPVGGAVRRPARQLRRRAAAAQGRRRSAGADDGDRRLDRQGAGHRRGPSGMRSVALDDERSPGRPRHEPTQGEDRPPGGRDFPLGQGQAQQHGVSRHHGREDVAKAQIADRVNVAGL